MVAEPQSFLGHKLVTYEGKLDLIVKTGFGLAESVGAKLWGGTIEARPKYLSQTALIGNALIVGGFQGCYSGDPIFTGPERTYREPFEEDGETSLQAFVKYGANVRLDYLSLWTQAPTAGGIRGELVDRSAARDDEQAAQIRTASNLAAFSHLVNRYPGIVSLGIDSDRGTMELKYADLGNVRIPRGIVETQFGQL